MIEDWRSGGFGLYIHWPFCQSKCPYCDFNSHVASRIDQTLWRDAYLAEIRRMGIETHGRILQTVFFGGGTPSLMDPEVVADILSAVRRTWQIANDFEVTLESNPTSVESGRFRAYRDAGVNRVSLGVQSLRDADLQKLGRRHSAREARQAFEIARDNFERVSFDLMYARQGQTAQDWRDELKEALSMAVDHVSLYQLTIEPGTAFGERFSRGGLRDLPDDDVQADMYALTQEVCDQHGMQAYEVSNHARPGSECRHNMIYWQMGDYIGIGPGAHGRLTVDGQRWATTAPKSPDDWLSGVNTEFGRKEHRELITGHEQASEYMMMSMRLSEGMDVARFERLSGYCLPEEKLAHLQELNLIRLANGRLQTTLAGRLVLNAILRDLMV